MTMMALFNRIQSPCLIGHLLLLLHSFTVSAITNLVFYSDASCEGTSSNATVSPIAHDGLCGHPNVTGGSLAATVSGMSLDYDCTGQSSRMVSMQLRFAISSDANLDLVTGYSDPYCNNDARAASVNGSCTTFPFTFESYSVDCLSVNGSMTIDEDASGSGTGDSSADSETSTPSPAASVLLAQAAAVGSTTSTTPQLPMNTATSASPQDSAQPISTSSITKASMSSPTPTTENNILVNTASTPAAPTTRSSQALSSTPTNTSTSSNSNSNTNLSSNDEIVIGVVIPCVAIIVAILIGFDQRRRFVNGHGAVYNLYYTQPGNGTRRPSVAPSGVESTTSRPMAETDVESANRDP